MPAATTRAATTRGTTAPPESDGLTAGQSFGLGPEAQQSALELTLSPAGGGSFFEEHWDRRPLLVARSEEGRFDAILSREQAERLVCETGIRTPALRAVKDGAQVPLGEYTEDVPWRPGSFSGRAVVDSVAAEFEHGATVVLQGLHLHHHSAALYCRALEAELGCPVQANAYLTPAAAQGFAVHHDTHDVFVLQVAGRKRWRWYEPLLELPLSGQRWSPELGELGEPVADEVLAPGDTLYLPRGWPHEAETSDEESLHLTIGIHPPTRLDALRAALDSCGDEVEFRRALADDGALPEGLLERLGERLAPDDVARRARRKFLLGRKPIRERRLTQAAALDDLEASDPVRRNWTALADLQLSESGATLIFDGKEVTFPAQAVTALAAIYAQRGEFSARDLPGPLDEAGRLVLLRRLLREGFLQLGA